ncbi:MAG: gcrA cell cycle regulator family protein [Alphaproteobacteria bacterium]|nr:gcrA cell cycle regulator family protein [Alphaproteobacteria bacterium]
MSWTEERVSLLRKLWGEGHTAAEIAKQLGGVTRNAVIGKAHRLKLSNRVSPIQQNKKPANKNIERKTVKKATPIGIVSSRSNISVSSSLSGQDVQRDSNNSEELYSLMDLKPRMCRWPCGDPKHEDFGFCGDLAMPGLPYCEKHAKMAYQASTRNRIFSADKETKEVRVQLKKLEEKKKATA